MEPRPLERRLIEASTSGRFSVVRECIENGANIHANDDDAFRRACWYSHMEIVEYLIEQEANIHAKDDEALYSSAYNGQLEVLKCLIQNGVINDAILLSASHRGHLGVVKFLLETYDFIYKKHIDLALIYSVTSGNYHLIKYLIEQGANINANNKEALEDASKFHHVHMVIYLLDSGAIPLEDNKTMMEYIPVNPRKRLMI